MNKYKVIIPTYEMWNVIRFNDEKSIENFKNLCFTYSLKVEYDLRFETPTITKISFKWSPDAGDNPDTIVVQLGECFMYNVDEPYIWKVIKYEDIKEEWYIEPCD